MIAKEIAKPDELSNLMNIHGWRHLSQKGELFPARSDSFRGQDETEVSDLGVAKETFGEIDLELMLLQFGENFVQDLQVVLVCRRVDDDVVDVDDDVLESL